MKRFTLSALFALIAGFFIFGAAPASAAVVTCTVDGRDVWPGAVLYNCYPGNTGTGSYEDMAYEALMVSKSNAVSQLKGTGGVFYVFKNAQDYTDSCQSLGIFCTTPGNLAGITEVVIEPNGMSTTVLFALPPSGVTFPPIQVSATHEEGHQLDPVYGIDLGSQQLISASTQFVNRVNQDWAHIKATTGTELDFCLTPGSSRTPVFKGLQDSGGNYICDGTEGLGQNLVKKYSKLKTIKAVLQKAWPYYYKPITFNSVPAYSELWSEEVAYGTGFVENPPYSPDPYLNALHLFPCSQTVTNKLIQTGDLPTQSDFPTGKGCS